MRYTLPSASGPNFPIRYIGLSLGLQDPKGLPANCGTRGVNYRIMISSIIIRQNCMPYSLVKFSFLYLFRFRVDNPRVFQRVFMNLKMTVSSWNLSVDVALIVWFTTNGMCSKNNNIYTWREQAIIEWSRRVNSIVACCHSAKLCAHAARAFRSHHGQAACRLLCRYTQWLLGVSYICWIARIVTCE